MGFFKNLKIQEDEQGWSFTDKAVCCRCVNEEALQTILCNNSGALLRCSFCSDGPAAPLNMLLQPFVVGLSNEYEDGLESSIWKGRDDGIQKWDTC